MSRVLPAHVIVGAGVAGLALANAVRGGVATVLVALALLVAGLLASGVGAPVAIWAAVALMLGWGWGSRRLDALDRSPLRADVGRAGRFVAVVTAEARVGAFSQRLFAHVRTFEGRPVSEPVELQLPLGRAPPQGAIVDVLAVVRAPKGPSDGFDERTWLRRQGVHVVLHVDEWHVVGRRAGLGGVADRLRRWLRRGSSPGLSGERRAVLEGVVLGDDTGLSSGLKNSFRRSGLYHLLAVSGQNVVLIAAGMLGLACLLGLPRACGHLASLAAIGAYVLAVGPQPSVIRAAVAGAAVSVAWLSSRDRDPWHALLLAAAVLLAWNPYSVYDAGFQLSFAAVLAIFLVVRPLVSRLEGYPVPAKLAAAVSVSIACGAATAPILWLQFGRVPLLGVVANALVEPVVGVLLGVGLVTAVVGLLAPGLAASLAALNGWVALYIAGCARGVAAVPFAQASGAGAVVAGVGSIAAAAYAWSRWRTSSDRST